MTDPREHTPPEQNRGDDRERARIVSEYIDRLNGGESLDPLDVMERYRNGTLCIDVMVVNGISFLTMISHNINFRTATKIDGSKDKHIMTGIQTVRK